MYSFALTPLWLLLKIFQMFSSLHLFWFKYADASVNRKIRRHVVILSIIFPWRNKMMRMDDLCYAIACILWKISSNLKIKFAVSIFKGQFSKDVLNSWNEFSNGDYEFFSSFPESRKPEIRIVFPPCNAQNKLFTLLCCSMISVC